MSLYYVPRPQSTTQSQHDAGRSPSDTASSESQALEEGTGLQLEHSVFIFPAPSSVPLTPSDSSTFSAPSDFTDRFSLSSGTPSGDLSFTPSTGSPARSPLVIHRRSVLRRRSSQRDITDPEVEVWDWTAESSDDIPDEEAVWEFEAELERMSHWELPPHLVGPSLQSRIQNTTRVYTPNNDFFDQHYRVYIRSRTQSHHNTLSSSSTQSSRATLDTPHPRIHIPLLSFFTSLLSLDLEDPALRLLTRSSTDSILFPGQSGLLGDALVDEPVSDPEYLTRTLNAGSILEGSQSKLHGLLYLFSDNGTNTSSTHPLKGGLAVVCDPETPYNPFALPKMDGLYGLCRLVGDIWSKGGKAWNEVRLSRRP